MMVLIGIFIFFAIVTAMGRSAQGRTQGCAEETLSTIGWLIVILFVIAWLSSPR